MCAHHPQRCGTGCVTQRHLPLMSHESQIGALLANAVSWSVLLRSACCKVRCAQRTKCVMCVCTSLTAQCTDTLPLPTSKSTGPTQTYHQAHQTYPNLPPDPPDLHVSTSKSTRPSRIYLQVHQTCPYLPPYPPDLPKPTSKSTKPTQTYRLIRRPSLTWPDLPTQLQV